MEWTIQLGMMHVLMSGWTIMSGECSCDLIHRVTQQDSDIIASSRTSPCELTMQSTLRRQVVAALYELQPDCAEPNAKGKIEIYDGTNTNRSLIIGSCTNFGRDVSYASRRKTLTIRIIPPYKPFKLKIYSIDTDETYLTPTGMIQSQRFQGHIGQTKINTTPNNFQAFYRIKAPENVTITASFEELYIDIIDGSFNVCDDKLILHLKERSEEYCGLNQSLPEIMIESTDELTLELLTDSKTVYTGFKITYVACFREVQVPDKDYTGVFHFPLYDMSNKNRCYLGIHVVENKQVTINWTFIGEKGKRCKDMLQVIADGINVTEILLQKCTLGIANTISLLINNNLKLFSTLESTDERINGICIRVSDIYCDLASRIKKNDTNVTVLQNDESCTLTLTALNDQQVVVVMYDVTADCTEKATVAIYDGRSTNDTLLTDKCQTYPWSFASRNHSLTLTPVPGKILRQFSIDIYAIDTTQTFSDPSGTVRSQRFLGAISGVHAHTTPNNFQVVYQIQAKTAVTILLNFQELRIRQLGLQCEDYIQIKSSTVVTSKLCGDNVLPTPISILAKTLTIAFFTDKQFTYTGFTASYKVCIKEVNGTNGTIDFHTFQDSENMACAYVINVRELTRISFFLTFDGNGGCSDFLAITSAGVTYTPRDCTSDYTFSGTVDTTDRVILHFTFGQGQSVAGTFSTETINTNATKTYVTYSNSEGTFLSPVVYITPSVVVPVLIAIIAVVIVIQKRKKRSKTEGREYEQPLPRLNDLYMYSEAFPEQQKLKVNSNVQSTLNRNIYESIAEPVQGENYLDVICVSPFKAEQKEFELKI